MLQWFIHPSDTAGRQLNELFHCGPYEVKASKFLSFFALAASLPFNQPSRRQKMAPPSAFKPSLRRSLGFFWRGGGGTSSLKLCLPSSPPPPRPRHPGGRGCQGCSIPSTAERRGALPGPWLLPPHSWDLLVVTGHQDPMGPHPAAGLPGKAGPERPDPGSSAWPLASQRASPP